MQLEQPNIVMEIVTDPVELAAARALDERFERNSKWFDAHATEIYRTHRGKCYCVSGEELFVADTPAEAIVLAKAAHPDDIGRFTGIIPKEKAARIYVDQGRVATVCECDVAVA